MKKDRHIDIRVSEAEKTGIEDAARRRGLSVSAYLLTLAYADSPALGGSKNPRRRRPRGGGSSRS